MVNYILYRIGQFIALHLPLKLAYLLAVFVSDLHYIFADKDRRAVKENLKVIFPEKTGRQIRQIRVRMFRNFAKYLVDFFRFQEIDLEYIKRNVKIENINYLEQGLAYGKGVIILSAHIGNWEMGGVAAALSGYPLWVVALPHKNKKVNDFFNFQRESKGVKVIPVGKAARACLNLLKENKIIALVGDRDFSEKGVEVDFFGKPTLLPEGPAAFSSKTGAAIVPGFVVRNNDDSFTLRFEEPIYNTAHDPEGLIKQYKSIIEDYIRRYPQQWHMFRRFWIS